MARLRVMAWNVHGFRAGTRRVADAVAAERPDVVLLNEAGRTGIRLRRAARRAGMDRVSGLRFARPVPNAVLVRPPWRVVERSVIAFSREGRTPRRGAAVAVLGRAGHRVVVAAAHLGLAVPERLRHAEELTDGLAARREWVVIGGDLNEDPAGPAASWLAQRYWDAFAEAGEGPGHTFPARAPRARIDYVFVSAGVRVERAWVGEPGGEPASDHLPVLADLLLGEERITPGR